MTRRSLWPAGLLVAAVLAAPQAARPADAEKPPTEPGFSISGVDTPSFFAYKLAPGKRAGGAIRLTSTSKQTVRVMLRAVDVATAASGGLEYGSAPARGGDPELDVARQGVRLDPGVTVDVPFTATVPRNARPGDRFGGIIALNRAQVEAAKEGSDREGFSLKFLPRLAIAVQVTVPGPAPRELTVGNVGIDVTPTSTDVTLLLRNSGAKLIRRTGGKITVTQGDRELVRRRVALDSFVPGTTLRYRVPLTGRPAEGSYRVTGVLRPEDGEPVTIDETVSFGARASREFRRETGREATTSGPSTALIAALAGAALVVLLLAAALIRSQRRLRAAAVAGTADHARD